MINATESLHARLDKHSIIELNTGCWLWTSSLNHSGYGMIGFGSRTRSAHRMSYERFKGPIPDGLQIDHLCRTPPENASSDLKHVRLDDQISRCLLDRFFIPVRCLFGKDGKESREPIHGHPSWNAFLHNTLGRGGLTNVGKRCGDFLAHIFVGKLKLALALPFLGFIRRHCGRSSVNHTGSGESAVTTNRTQHQVSGQNTLLPCPFCGGQGIIRGNVALCVNDISCGCEVRGEHTNREAVIAAWNRRQAPSVPDGNEKPDFASFKQTDLSGSTEGRADQEQSSYADGGNVTPRAAVTPNLEAGASSTVGKAQQPPTLIESENQASPAQKLDGWVSFEERLPVEEVDGFKDDFGKHLMAVTDCKSVWVSRVNAAHCAKHLWKPLAFVPREAKEIKEAVDRISQLLPSPFTSTGEAECYKIIHEAVMKGEKK